MQRQRPCDPGDARRAPGAWARAASATTTPSGGDGEERERHPKASASPGRTRPAIAAPAGTPVCLIEKVSAMRSGGVVRASSWTTPA